jgi:hypothetical protein
LASEAPKALKVLEAKMVIKEIKVIPVTQEKMVTKDLKEIRVHKVKKVKKANLVEQEILAQSVMLDLQVRTETTVHKVHKGIPALQASKEKQDNPELQENAVQLALSGRL